MEVVLTTGAIRCAKFQSYRHHQSAMLTRPAPSRPRPMPRPWPHGQGQGLIPPRPWHEGQGLGQLLNIRTWMVIKWSRLFISIYLAESVRWTADVEGRCHLRSSTTMKLVVPSVQWLTLGDRAFPVTASQAWWNSLPSAIRTVSSFTSFRQQLKTLRHICLGSVLANFLLPSSLLLWLCKVPLHRPHDSVA